MQQMETYGMPQIVEEPRAFETVKVEEPEPEFIGIDLTMSWEDGLERIRNDYNDLMQFITRIF